MPVTISGGTYSYATRFLDISSTTDRSFTVKNVTLSGASHFLYMTSNARANVTLENVTVTSREDSIYIASGVTGSLTMTDCEIASTGAAMLHMAASVATHMPVTVNSGTYSASSYVIQTDALSTANAKGEVAVITINGGSFLPYAGRTLKACVMTSATIVVINGGVFESSGANVLYAGGGEYNAALGQVIDYSAAFIHITDGQFILRENMARGQKTDAVIAAGDNKAYAMICIDGGVLQNDRTASEQDVFVGEASAVTGNGVA